ncbi:MAG: hypothetical protein OXG44_17380 [Gammaproteobacteria bacterium]|nr:hypothetical protein [Gammaproteobacteria bacterium]
MPDPADRAIAIVAADLGINGAVAAALIAAAGEMHLAKSSLRALLARAYWHCDPPASDSFAMGDGRRP